jgi:hypothetical protein
MRSLRDTHQPYPHPLAVSIVRTDTCTCRHLHDTCTSSIEEFPLPLPALAAGTYLRLILAFNSQLYCCWEKARKKRLLKFVASGSLNRKKPLPGMKFVAIGSQLARFVEAWTT